MPSRQTDSDELLTGDRDSDGTITVQVNNPLYGAFITVEPEVVPELTALLRRAEMSLSTLLDVDFL